MRERLQRVFREVFDNDSLTISDETSYENLEGWDSMAQVRLVVALQEEFDTKLTTDEVVEATSVEAIETILADKGVAA